MKQIVIENKFIKIISIGIIFSYLMFPILNDLRPMIREVPPHGVPGAKAYHGITLNSYLNGKWQKRVTERAKLNSGLWTPLLKVGNQIMFNLFSQLGIYQNTSVFHGNNKYLIQDTHVSEFNNRKDYNPRLNEQLIKFKHIQDYQKKRGKSFILLITPNLIHLYPELLPDSYLDPTRESRESRYSIFKRELEISGIDYVDSAELLFNIKDNYPFKLFARTASHWNDVASCTTLNSVSKKLSSLNLPSFPLINCDNYKIEQTPKGKDTDLLDMANLLFPNILHEPTPYVESPQINLEFKQPQVLLVGTSYLQAIYKHIKDWNMHNGLTYYFYFKQYKTTDSNKFHPLRRSKLNWDDLLSKDVIIVNIGVSDMNGMGSGFIEEAYKRIPK